MKRIIRERLRRRVVVTLKTGDSFDGVLYEVDSEAVILRNASAIGPGVRESRLPVDGEVLLLRADVAYLQLP